MMEHKAFLFDYDSFERELRPILEDALVSGDVDRLAAFVNTNLANVRDPYEGEPLDADWESLIEIRDTHNYGDFALTKYYDPTADIGLGAGWEEIQELIGDDLSLLESPILGSTIGPQDASFDPGKMGSYFQSPQQVHHNYKCLLSLRKQDRISELNKAIQMLDTAMKLNAGLYITF